MSDDDEKELSYRAHGMAIFAVAKTQAGSGDIADLPAWFLTDVHVSKEWKEKHLVSVTLSVFWKPYLEPNECFEIVNGDRILAVKDTKTGETSAIAILYGGYELNRIDLFKLEVDLTKNIVLVSEITDLRVINPDLLDLPKAYRPVSPQEYKAKCFTYIKGTPTVDYPDFLNKRKKRKR